MIYLHPSQLPFKQRMAMFDVADGVSSNLRPAAGHKAPPRESNADPSTATSVFASSSTSEWNSSIREEAQVRCWNAYWGDFWTRMMG